MGSSCAKEIPRVQSPKIPEGIVELKKQRQFTEDWKSKFDVTLSCYFTTVSKLYGKIIPGLIECKGIIVVQLVITSKDPSFSKLYSILNKPVLQWHGIDIKTQLPSFFPYNMWEGEHTTFAFFDPETSIDRGFCTVTGKIGQEEILIEEELRFENQVPTLNWNTLTEQLEHHLKTLQQSVKKTKISIGISSQRNSHDTGYTSEHTPYRALRYNDHDTDSDQENVQQQKQSKERRSKLRRKDTPAVHVISCIKPCIKHSPQKATVPLIEEMEMNSGLSDEHSASSIRGASSSLSHGIKDSTNQTSKRKKKSITLRLIQDDNVEHVDHTTKRLKESKIMLNPAEDADDEDEHGISTDMSDLWTQPVGEIPVDSLFGKPGRPRLYSERLDELSMSDFGQVTGDVPTYPVKESEQYSSSKDNDNKGETDGNNTYMDKHAVENERTNETTNIDSLIEVNTQIDEDRPSIIRSEKQEKSDEAIGLQQNKLQPIIKSEHVCDQLIDQHYQNDNIPSTIHPTTKCTVDELRSMCQSDDAEEDDETVFHGHAGSPAEESQMRVKSESFSVMNRKVQFAKKCRSVCSSELSAQLKQLSEPREETKPPVSPKKSFIEFE